MTDNREGGGPRVPAAPQRERKVRPDVSVWFQQDTGDDAEQSGRLTESYQLTRKEKSDGFICHRNCCRTF